MESIFLDGAAWRPRSVSSSWSARNFRRTRSMFRGDANWIERCSRECWHDAQKRIILVSSEPSRHCYGPALPCHFLEDPPCVRDTGFRYFRSNVLSRSRDVICRMLFLADCISRIKFWWRFIETQNMEIFGIQNIMKGKCSENLPGKWVCRDADD